MRDLSRRTQRRLRRYNRSVADAAVALALCVALSVLLLVLVSIWIGERRREPRTRARVRPHPACLPETRICQVLAPAPGVYSADTVMARAIGERLREGTTLRSLLPSGASARTVGRESSKRRGAGLATRQLIPFKSRRYPFQEN